MVYYKKSKTSQKIFLGVFSVIVFFVTSVYVWLKSTLPEYSGEKALAHLKRSVEVYRDSYGIPHIYAENESDLYIALGYTMAQDRMFQMDLIRRAVSGKLSEILGKEALSIDKLFLTIQGGKNFKEHHENLKPELKNIYENIAKGINGYLSTGVLPIEFKALNYKPELWSSQDSFGLLYFLAWSLDPSFNIKLFCFYVKSKISEDVSEALCPTNVNFTKKLKQENKIVLTHDVTNSIKSEIFKELMLVDQKARSLLQVATRGGSNSWLVGASKSKTGFPLLASDMHLSVSQPGIWYVAHLVSPELHLSGVFLPGAPFALAGSNTKVMWAFTNIAPDDCDFYEEKFSDELADSYKVGDHFEKIKTIEYKIPVKGGATENYQIQLTRHGPIINELFQIDETTSKRLHKKNVLDKPISMQWTLHKYQEEDLALFYLNRASTIEDIEKAAIYFKTPGQNWVYADKAGNIGYTPAACIPLRKDYTSFEIQDGSKTSGEWGKCLNMKSLSLKNPIQGWVASANERLSEKEPFISNQFYEASFRKERIQELLEEKEKLDIEDFARMQKDTKNFFINEWKSALKSLDKEKLTKIERVSYDILLKWDGASSADDVPAASIFYSLWSKAFKNLFLRWMSKEELELFKRDWIMPLRALRLALADENNFLFKDKENKNGNDKGKKDVGYTQKKWLLESFQESIKFLKNKFGSNIKKWKWGELHKIVYKHPLSSRKSFFNKLFNRGPYPVDGGILTLNPMGFDLLDISEHEYFTVNQAASERLILSLEDPDSSLFSLPSGASGNFMSKHYDDQIKDYINNKYRSLYFSRNKVVENSKYHLILKPN